MPRAALACACTRASQRSASPPAFLINHHVSPTPSSRCLFRMRQGPAELLAHELWAVTVITLAERACANGLDGPRVSLSAAPALARRRRFSRPTPLWPPQSSSAAAAALATTTPAPATPTPTPSLPAGDAAVAWSAVGVKLLSQLVSALAHLHSLSPLVATGGFRLRVRVPGMGGASSGAIARLASDLLRDSRRFIKPRLDPPFRV